MCWSTLLGRSVRVTRLWAWSKHRPASLFSAPCSLRRYCWYLAVRRRACLSRCVSVLSIGVTDVRFWSVVSTALPQVINALDMCVEIPQFGVIRSLNVHVSASLLLWEYTRQRVLRGLK